jgi:hypothetical protein
MKVAVCYVYPNLQPRIYVSAARRFVQSYQRHPPGTSDHSLWVLVNGGELGGNQRRLFDDLPCHFLNHNNTGKDIGAFQKAAAQLTCDLMVCLGAFVNCCWTGWLDRMVRAVEDYGPTLYGAWGFHQPRPHIRTTAFWLPRELFNLYPNWVGTDYRYEFEHGRNSLTAFVRGLGLDTHIVTRNEVLPLKQWRHIREEECLLLDQHTQSIGYRAK